jgi:cysteine-rich CWC protein
MVRAELGHDRAPALRRLVTRQAERHALARAFDARADRLIGDRPQLGQHADPDGAAVGRSLDRRPRHDLGRLVGIAMELRDGADASARPRGMRIANVIDEQISKHGRTIQRKRARMQVMVDHCPRCGIAFECSPAGRACWCTELPPLPITGDLSVARCLCRRCLEERVGEFERAAKSAC